MRIIRFILLFIIFSFSFQSCYDFETLENELDNANGRIDGIEQRLSALEQLCSRMNTDISAMQTVVTALQNNDYVVSVSDIEEQGEVVGYSIVFSKSGTIKIYHGTDGKDGNDGKDGIDGIDGIDGENGRDGYVPTIGVLMDTDGVYYWTIDGEWLLDASGNKIKAVGEKGDKGDKGDAGDKGDKGDKGDTGDVGNSGAAGNDGITPNLKIENEYWYVSYDNGESWIELGKATGEDGVDGNNGDSFFNGVDTSDPDYVVFILSDGTRISIPSKTAFDNLRAAVNQINTNISALQTIVNALKEKDYIESIVYNVIPEEFLLYK